MHFCFSPLSCNYYSEAIQCKDLSRDKNLPIIFMTKNVLKHELKYSNCSGHFTDGFMSLLWLFKKSKLKKKKKKLLGRTLLSRKFSLHVMNINSVQSSA